MEKILLKIAEKHSLLVLIIVALVMLSPTITTLITSSKTQRTIESVRTELVNMHEGDFMEVKSALKLSEVRDALNEPLSNASKKYVGKLWDEYVSFCSREKPVPIEPSSYYRTKVEAYLQ